MIVINGVTGNTGKVAAEALLARGKKVRVVVRDAQKGAPFAAKGADVAVADLRDTKAFTKALDGAEGVYLLLPPAYGEKSFRAYQDATSASIATAVRDAKVPHAVLLSSVGANLPSGTGPIAGLYVLEKQLGEIASTKSTFIRAGFFMENLGQSLAGLPGGVLPSFLPADLPIDMIATKDIGTVAADALAAGPKQRVINLGGPAVTMTEVAAILTRLTGKSITVAEAPLDAVVPALTGAGLTEDMAKLYQELFAGFGSGKIAWEPQHERVHGTTKVDEVLKGLLAKG